MRTFQLKRTLVLVLAGFALLHGLIFWQLHDSIFRGYGDFASFYTAGKIVQQGESARLYDRGLQWQVQQQFASSVKIRNGPLPYIRPPFEALLFLPFAYLDYPVAFVAWTAVNVLVLLTVPFLLVRETGAWAPVPSPLARGFLSLGFFPIAFDLVQGQDSILLLMLLALAFVSLQKGSELRAGAWLGLGLFKFHLVVPLFLVLLLTRRMKATVGFIGVASVLGLLSVAVVGWPALVGYPGYLWALNEAPALAGMKAQAMPNIRGLLTPFLGHGRVPLPVQGALLGISILGVVSMAKVWPAGGDSLRNRVGFSFCIVATIFTSYYANSYDLTLLILPLLLVGGALADDHLVHGWPRTLFEVCAGLLLCSPLYWVLALRIDQFYWVVWLLLAFATSLAAMVRPQQPQMGHC